MSCEIEGERNFCGCFGLVTNGTKNSNFQNGEIVPLKAILIAINSSETSKYWVGVQWGQYYLMERRCYFSLGWPPF